MLASSCTVAPSISCAYDHVIPLSSSPVAVKENSLAIPSPLPIACVPVVPVFPKIVYVAFALPETVNSPANADVAIATEEITENNNFVNLFIVSPFVKTLIIINRSVILCLLLE